MLRFQNFTRWMVILVFRNDVAHFSSFPSVSMDRSIFEFNKNRLTSFDAGLLYPIFDMEILPGDTISLDMASVTRMQTPLFPVMDNCYLDTYFFYIPNRLVWLNWKKFCGESNVNAWERTEDLTVPMITAGNSGFASGSVADHLGMPINIPGIVVSALPYRMIQLVWNRWFRNQNVQNALLVQSANSVTSAEKTFANGRPLPVNRFRDYFSSCLPAPQKGAAVQLPLSGTIPVFTSSNIDFSSPEISAALASSPALKWFTDSNDASYGNRFLVGVEGATVDDIVLGEGANVGYLRSSTLNELSESNGVYSSEARLQPANLAADLSLGVGYSTVNSLRQAFAVQRILEKDARAGTRYTEILRSHFSVIAPDASLQDPEYLGGMHTMLNMDQVLQTSSTDDVSPLGNTGAFSKTNSAGSVFTKSFTEHGRIMGFACIRTDRSYQQGIPRSYLRKTRYDFYWPALAHVGEQPVYVNEIYAGNQEEVVDPELVFGYQEAFVDYRVGGSEVTGAFRKDYVGGQGYNAWHYADWYDNRPYLTDAWMQEGKENVARTLAASDLNVDSQFIANFLFKIKAARCMPLYGIPGLIDHF